MKTCIHVAAKHVGAFSVSLHAGGMLVSDEPLEKQLMESLFSHEVDCMMNQRLAAYFEKFGFRMCNAEIDPMMVMDLPSFKRKRSDADKLMEEA